MTIIFDDYVSMSLLLWESYIIYVPQVHTHINNFTYGKSIEVSRIVSDTELIIGKNNPDAHWKYL